MSAHHHNVAQNTEEWFLLRAGKITGSDIGKIMANSGGAFGEPAKKLAINKAVERITGSPIKSEYQNKYMERGHELEPMAIMEYENTYFCDVKSGGFYDAEIMGCSPDGLLEDGIIEIKSVIPTTHFANIKRAGVDPAYKHQCNFNLMISEKEWLDFISYCPEFPENKRLFVFRIFKKNLQKEFSEIKERVKKFNSLIESNINIIKGN
jgi:hypothetical protein